MTWVWIWGIIILGLAFAYSSRHRQFRNWFRSTPYTNLPIVYSPEHNIGPIGIEKILSFFHPFDSAKYGKIISELENRNVIQDWLLDTFQSKMCTRDDLLLIHTKEYVDERCSDSAYLAKACQFPPFAFIPNFILQHLLLTPLWYHVGATIKAARKSLQGRGWAIALSGGMHHASSEHGSGWCIYSDISIAIKKLYNEGRIKNAMIIDLDAHQGNGYARDKLDNLITPHSRDDVFIMDVYNAFAFPMDMHAKSAINVDLGLKSFTEDVDYMKAVAYGLQESFKRFSPDIVFYNAGSDIISGDDVGKLRVSHDAMIKRDEMVFRECINRKIPIVMLLSGGYAPDNYKYVADSIENLVGKFK